MKAVLGSIAVLGGLLAAGPASMHAATPQATTTATDQTLDSRIEKRINASTLKKYNLDVAVKDGVATLTGTVSTEADRRKAAQLATVPGVARVDNQLVVNLAPGPNTKGTAGTVESKTDRAAEKTKKGVDKAMDKTKEGLSKTGEVITDGWITSRVKMKFVGEDLLKDSDIDVDVKDHVVTLSGTVMSEAGRARAIAQAREVEGVHQVVDRMTIGTKKQ